MEIESNKLIYIGKNKLSKSNKKLLEIPKLELHFQLQIVNLKKENVLIILVGCILSKFGITLCQQICLFSLKQVINSDQSQKYSIIQYFTILFSQGFVGFTVDLISLKASWRFTQIISLMGMLIYIFSSINKNVELIILANILIKFGYSCNYICGTYILYDSSYYLNKRFFHQSLFIAIGSFVPYIICSLLDWLQILEKIDQEYLIEVISICLLINLIGDFIVSQFYSKLDEVKSISQNYQQFLKYRGVAISIRSIINYYWNKNIIYLAITLISIRTLCSLNNTTFIAKSINQGNSNSYILKLIFYTSAVTLGIWVIFKVVQKQKKIISISYYVIRNFIIITLISQIVLTVVLQFQSQLEFHFTLLVCILSMIFKGITFMLSSILCNQLLISLQSEKSSIRCMGIGLFGICQNAFEIFYYLNFNPNLLNYIINLIGVLYLVYSFYYLQNRRFNLLDQYAYHKQIASLENSQLD